ncbi:DUF3089 domain-containing protein [Steroidobacter sp. S1-65]|uniref:DUF3089 domain-containing protein n=1 Tax=Steroidobacter gossypii TaxID=2805490 RepID=A0ABS1WTE4_9GAMM|nr:DUF3089 domain-containing protein [Steroidobacter gossypii]MBM0104242.1 DUF3089 domain-containing protein [Steroidobacter gossypii]
MKKILIGALTIALLASAASYIYRDEIRMMMAFNKLKPAVPFRHASSPASPDYSREQSWAALPNRVDSADALPAIGVMDQQASAAVDVFFIHPTTYFGTDNWNQSVDDARVNQLTDMFVMRGQASVFNSCCRIYAPRYRQATIYSFLDRSGSGASALQLAYNDVERAFDYFLQNYSRDRPFVLAAHSQGSAHLSKLLERRITGTHLRNRLVAAYPIGFSLDAEALARSAPDVPVCESAEQTGCMVSWNAVGPDAKQYADTSKNICVNPLTWKTDGAPAAADLNLGGVSYPGTFKGTLADLQALPQDFIDAQPIVEPRVADARCENGMLLVREIHSAHYSSRPMGRDNYHIYDYHLFAMNLRQNAELRVAQYLANPPKREITRPKLAN